MAYKSGDFIELPNGRSVRLNKDTAEIANAAVEHSAAKKTEKELDEQYAETGDCDCCGKRVPLSELTFVPAGHLAAPCDTSACHNCMGHETPE